jgi:hypothetical protein
MAWCSVKHRDNFIFFLYNICTAYSKSVVKYFSLSINTSCSIAVNFNKTVHKINVQWGGYLYIRTHIYLHHKFTNLS